MLLVTGNVLTLKLTPQQFSKVVESLRKSDLRDADLRDTTRLSVDAKLTITYLTDGKSTDASTGKPYTSRLYDLSLSGIGLLQSVPIKPNARFTA
jgi:hypothetical protein